MAMGTRARRARRLIGGVALLGALMIPAQGAAAQYGPPDEPTLEVEVLQPICDGNVPYLQYAVSVVNAVGDSATITWHHPNDPTQNQVMSGVPLSGTVLWPGAEVDEAGNAIDWPGWRLEGDEWVEGDQWDWVRPSVQITVAVNPEATVTVAYPPSSPNCMTDPPGKTTPRADPDPAPGTAQASGENLPLTGASVGWLVSAGAGLLLLGTALILLRKRAARD